MAEESEPAPSQSGPAAPKPSDDRPWFQMILGDDGPSQGAPKPTRDRRSIGGRDSASLPSTQTEATMKATATSVNHLVKTMSSLSRAFGLAASLIGILILAATRLQAVDYDFDQDGRVDFRILVTHTNISIPPSTSYSITTSEMLVQPDVSVIDIPAVTGSFPVNCFGRTIGTESFTASGATETSIAKETYGVTSGVVVNSRYSFVHDTPYFIGFRLKGARGYRYGWAYLTGGYGDLIASEQGLPLMSQSDFHAPSRVGLMPEGATQITLPEAIVTTWQVPLGYGPPFGGKVVITWDCGRENAALERSSSLTFPDWKPILTGVHGNFVTDPSVSAGEFFRVN